MILDVVVRVGELATLPRTHRGTVQIYDFDQVQSIYLMKIVKPSKICVPNPENPDLFWRGVFNQYNDLSVGQH